MIAVKISIDEFISLENKSAEQPTSLVVVEGGKKETERE